MQGGITQTGAQGTSGPPGGPGPGQASLPSVGSSSPDAFDPGRRLQADGQGAGVGATAGLGVLAAAGPEAGPGALVAAVAVGVGVAAGYDAAMFFEDLFGGGSPDYPPNYWTDVFRLNRRHGGRHPLYTAFIGMAPGIVPGMGGFHLDFVGGTPSPNQPLLHAGYRLPRWANPSLLKQEIKLALECWFEMSEKASGLGIALEACATVGELPAGPFSAGTCAAVAAAVLGPPTAILEYYTIRHCISEFAKLERAGG
jgi:hypothetical protein